ncbi:hypothetical protein F2Q70_00030789 [Brassica cretica]|uniref:Uncharacterized protein n=1 Tax=Brassica cretica TaxID=69181 RepID=A0A8S9FL65_BRACR|nr:hypothetical protein F2Q70_00030789 [Brassica cretica]
MVMQKSMVEDVRVDTMVVEVATRKEEVVVDTVGVGYGYREGVEFPEAPRAVASRFEGAFLSVARGARCSTLTSSGFFGRSSSCCLAG